MPKLPLEGIRIVDSSSVWAVPYAMGILSDMGAQVIKIDVCTRPDQRIAGSFPEGVPGERFWEQSAAFNLLHRGKLSLTLDLTKPGGPDVFRKLAAVSDIVVENNTPRVMKGFGLDYPALKAIKPNIIMLSNTGYGHSGPWTGYITMGRVIESMSGLTSMTGYPGGPPHKGGMAYTDFPVCWTALSAVLTALVHRNQTGQGQWIDMSMYEIGVSFLGEAVLEYNLNGRYPERMGNRHPSMAPHGCYRCTGTDAWVTIAVADDDEWKALCEAIDRPELAEDPRFADILSRRNNHDALDEIITAWTSTRDKYDAQNHLQAYGVAAGAVLSNKDLMLDPQIRARGFYEPVTHDPDQDGLGTRLYPGRPYKFSKIPVKISRRAPKLGEHNQFVLCDILGMTGDDMKLLEEAGTIGYRPVGTDVPRQHLPLQDQKRLRRILDYDVNYKELLGIS